MKHNLREPYYIRYCDDFVLLNTDRTYVERLIPMLEGFLHKWLSLGLHPKKIIVCKHSYGMDFLGYVVLPHHRVLRTKTRHRVLDRVARSEISSVTLPSYLEILKHYRGYNIKQRILEVVEQ